MIMFRRAEQQPLTEFSEKVKRAITGTNTAQDIQTAVAAMLKRYGIETPVKK